VKRYAKRKLGVIVDAPMAITSDGKVLFSVTHLIGGDAAHAMKLAFEAGLPVFVGVAVDQVTARQLVADLDDGLAEIVARRASAVRRRRPGGR
jgi:hypothetical protein